MVMIIYKKKLERFFQEANSSDFSENQWSGTFRLFVCKPLLQKKRHSSVIRSIEQDLK